MKAYNHKLPYKTLDDTVIQYLTTLIANNPKLQVLVELPNTRGITSEMIKKLPSNIDFRVSGGFNKTYLENRQKPEEYYEAVIYSRNELYHIITEMEKIESSFEPDWSDIEKMVIIYEKIKGRVQYDAKFESRPTSQVRTLRGFLSKQTVCAGYAMMFKEMLNRQGIGCLYACGKVPGGGRHAWNLVKIDDKIYPIDLTWDSSAYQRGSFKNTDYLGQNDEEFRKYHVPDAWNPVQDYAKNLSSLDPKLIEVIRKKMSAQRAFESSTHKGKRQDGTEFLIAQTGDAMIKGKHCYQYFYCDIEQGKYVNPMLLYSDTNLQAVLTQLRFGKPIPKGMDVAIGNILFSKENIRDSKQKGTSYVGRIYDRDKKSVYTRVEDIPKDPELSMAMSYPMKSFTRSDGSNFVLQQGLPRPNVVNGVRVMRYDAFEVVMENGMPIVKRNVLWTEQNLFKDNRPTLADDLLSRRRISHAMREEGGYIGHYDVKGRLVHHPNLKGAFQQKSALDTSNIVAALGLPTFDELKGLSQKYEAISVAPDQSWTDVSLIRAKDRKSNVVLPDPKLGEMVLFSDLWLGAAGVKWYFGDEDRDGYTYAFNDEASRLYEWLISKIATDIEVRGFIDTVRLLETCEEVGYKHSQDIIRRMFRTPIQTNFINDFFRKKVRMASSQVKDPQALLYYTAGIPMTNENGLSR